MKTFSVCAEMVTPESAEQGGSELEFIEHGLTLADAVKIVRQTRTAHCDGIEAIEADAYPTSRIRSVRIVNGMEFQTGASETRTLFIPESVTPATSRRIAKFLGV